MMLVDSHCHLDHLDLSEGDSLEAVIAEAEQHNVKHMLSVGLDLEQSKTVIDIAVRFSCVSASIGVHPTEPLSPLIENGEQLEETLVALGNHPKVVALGETGLDFYRESTEESKQQQVIKFRAHIRAAKKLKKPLIIHTRQAQNETVAVLKEEGVSEIGGVMHCFTETMEMAKACMAMNLFISLSGIVTFKNASLVQELARGVPLDRLLIETDAPYLAPMPYRGKPNRPAYVSYVAEKIAELRKESFESIASITTKNYFDLFSLSDRSVYVHSVKR